MSNSNILKIGSLLNKFPNNGSKIELSQELKDALVGVWLAYGKSNDSTDRNIIKNKIKDKGGDFVISNAAYKLNSGYGKYEEDFTDWRIYPNIKVTDNVITTNGNFNSTWFIYKHSSESKINEMNIKVSGIPKGGKIFYFYISDETDNLPIKYTIPKDGIYHLPESKINNNRVSVGFTVENRYDWNNIRIEQIPSFEGAFVTDGKDDFITSTKTVQEMLGGSNEITVVSMIHLVQTPAASSEKAYTNQIRTGQNYLRNYVTDNGKTGIYGYTCKGNNVSVINNILGDKNDYIVENKSWNNLAKFSVIGYEDNGTINELDQVAWYWTIIANKVLTTDQINQVIAYFNLDRTLKPDIRCNIERQGITNDNHADFNNKLIDYSGNGRDIQMYNLAWKGGSGIAAKPFETIKDYTIVSDEARQKLTIYNEFSYKVRSNTPNHYWTVQSIIKDNTSYQVTIITDKDCYWINSTSFINNEGNKESIRKEYPVKANTPTQVTICGLNEFEYPEDIEPTTAVSYVNLSYAGEVTVTFIPSCKGGLLLDGVNDFGKVTGMPIYKDYTFIIDYERISYTSEGWGGAIVSKSPKANNGAFISMMVNSAGLNKQLFSFGGVTAFIKDDLSRILFWQTKYKSENTELTVGEGVDGDTLWLGTLRDNDSRFFNGAIYSLMSFPYSMSEFLIERQLKKYKLGTLYPDMVEFRPIIKANDNYKIFYTAMLPLTGDIWERINIGDYVPVGRRIAIQMSFDNEAKKLVSAVSSQLGNITIVKNSKNIGYTIFGDVLKDKSPQKISITIEQDENYVLFNPVINSNYDNYKLTFYLREYEKLINIGDYIPKGTYIRANLYLKNNIDELVTFTFNGVNIDYVKSPVLDTAYNIGQIYNYDSPQEVNITIDEYIRYEDIVQPYPVLLRFNDENGNEVSWGGKFRVGSTITRIRSFYENNLIDGLYTVRNPKLNGNNLITPTHVVEKSMVFTCDTKYLLDNNEPKCILSPNRLRMPNSSYKILGYIPDISGHGNHGVIHNSAYAEMSGADGYPYDYNKSSFWCDSGLAKVVSGELIEYFAVKNSTGFSNITSGVYKGEIKVTGVTKAISENKISRLRIFTNSTTDKEIIDITQDGNYNIDIKGVGDANRVFFYAIPNNPNESIVVRLTEPIYIEQVGEYEGAYCLDGVDDYISIPTLVTKQSLIKCNWTTENYNKFLLDYRKDNASNGYSTNKTGRSDTQLAYNGRVTYIDGILNKNLIPDDNLKGITHCAVIQYPSNIESEATIASAFDLRGYMQMALYTYIAFSKFSTDEKIKQLNDIIGIEGNFVEWNPTITTNISSTYTISPNIKKSDGIIVKLVKGNIYSTSITGNLVLDIVPPNKDLDEVTNVIIDGKSYTPIKYQYVDYYRVEIPLVFPQEINITIDEYIRYESIEQPYPIFLNYIDKETNKTYTWGDKVKVDSILKISGYKNLFENGDTSLGGSNGYSVNGSSELIALGTLLTSEILVNKINTGVRSSVIWNLNTPKPLFAYDPSIINNVGLKNLGYLPDITGQGRHLLLNEFAYEGMSGINGYPAVFGGNKTWKYAPAKSDDGYIYTSDSNKYNITQIIFSTALCYSYIKYNEELTDYNKDVESFKIKVTGLESTKFILKYKYLGSADATDVSNFNILSDGIYEIPKSVISNGNITDFSWIGFNFTKQLTDIPDIITDVNVTIEILPNYEGSLYFDGVNDYGTVKNLTYGVKSLLMKINWSKNNSMLYDQRNNNNSYFGIFTSNVDINGSKVFAYGARNNGSTYIDGVLNKYILISDLQNISHNILITNKNIINNDLTTTPHIGNSVSNDTYAQMAMYKVMGLPEIPSDEEIKTLNNWAGIEAKVELPPYYWDTYGKTNLDADKATIQQRGVAVGDYDLTNTNFAYDKMSGFGGYTLGKFTNSWSLSNNSNSISIVARNPYDITLKKLGGNSDWEFNNTELKVISNPVSVKFKSNKNIRVTCDYHYYPVGGNSEGASLRITSKDLIANKDAIITISPISQENIDKYNIDVNRGYYLICFQLSSTLAVNEEVTIEMLPLYPNALLYDGVTDYSENNNIPALTDYTYIFKRELLNNTTDSCSLYKGDTDVVNGQGFVADYISQSGDIRQYSFGGYVNVPSLNTDKIIYGTKTSANGIPVSIGSGIDTVGMALAKWKNVYRKMVFYKLILYPKTITNLEIMFLKNMFERDEIINLNNPIFIQK